MLRDGQNALNWSFHHSRFTLATKYASCDMYQSHFFAIAQPIDVGSLEKNLRSVETCFAQAHSCTQASTSSTNYDSIIRMVYDSIASFC